ncbi:MAG: gfo/Idh/MocA family oxidoreductase, partial [bacterium]|nr:gfo/Idh/MocA family oxidoreductase [bacterium]
RDGWEVIQEPSKNNVLIERHEAPKQDLSRANHARNFLECVRSREDPVENLTVGHHVSTVAHLGNLAFRSGEPVTWDATRERVVGNKQADKLVGARYRRPWKLPYDPRE